MKHVCWVVLLMSACDSVRADQHTLSLQLLEPTPVVEVGGSVKLRISLGAIERASLNRQINQTPGAMMRESVFDFKGAAYPVNYDFNVTLNQVGDQEVGPLQLEWQGRTWATNPVQVTVIPANSQFRPGALTIQLYPQTGHKKGEQVPVKVSHISLENGALQLQLHPDLEHHISGWTQTRQTELVDGQYSYRHTVSFRVSCDQPEITSDESWFKTLPEGLEVRSKTIHCQ